MERRAFAVITVGAGLIMGLLGNILFFDRLIGISFPFYIILAVALVLLLARPARQPISVRNLWLLIPLAFFAIMVAFRADDLIVALNIRLEIKYFTTGLTRPKVHSVSTKLL